MSAHRTARELFLDLLERPAEEREAALAQATADDPTLRAEVEALLAAHDADAAFMSSPTASVAANGPILSPSALVPITERVGTVIGPYKLLQKIGEGGFGVVFLAEQHEPVRRRVAVKIIKLGMDTRQVVARFEAERQALALMDHPHIARVLDGGATPLTESGGGRPYFVMEYVTGDAITDFAHAHRLTLRQRLDLFTQVCAAVQHAHHKGIIHRDLKPANVLVTMTDGKPFAKVIDFGIAKATGAAPGTLTDKTLFTEHRQLLGTPEYMSPEQAEGLPDIDTRTDVYALGVLLYELLTGLTPFDARRLRSAAWGEMQRIIKEEDPPTPSVRLQRTLPQPAQQGSTALRAVSPPRGTGVPPVQTPELTATPDLTSTPTDRPRLAHTPPAAAADLRGELDWIVMKALDKDRARRYETPNQLAADVRRHLQGEAVLAAPPSAAYRVKKFVRRHKGPVIAGGAVAAALLVGIAGTAWQWQRASDALVNVLESQAAFVVEREQLVQSYINVLDSVGYTDLNLDDRGKLNFVNPGGERGYQWLVRPRVQAEEPARREIAWQGDWRKEPLLFNMPGMITEQLGAVADRLREMNASLMRQREIALQAIEETANTLFACDCPGEEMLPAVALMAGIRYQHPDASEEEISIRALAALSRSGAGDLIRQREVAKNSLADIIAMSVELDEHERNKLMRSEGLTEEQARREQAFAFAEGWRLALGYPPPDATSPIIEPGSISDVDLLARISTAFAQKLVDTRNLLAERTEAAEWSAYTANLALAQQAIEAGNYPEARERLAECPESKRGWEWTFLDLASRATLLGEPGRFDSASLSPDGSLVAMWTRYRTSPTAEVLIVNRDSKDSLTIRDHANRILEEVIWSPHGSHIAIKYYSWQNHRDTNDILGNLRILDIRGDIFRDFVSKDGLESMGWNLDGSRILTIYRDGTARIWDANGEDGEPLVLRYVQTAKWSPDGDRIATVWGDGSVRIVQVDGSDEVVVLEPHDAAAWNLAWSTDGTRLLVYSNLNYDNAAFVVHANGHKAPIVVHGELGAALVGKWSPDSRYISIGYRDGAAIVLDTEDIENSRVVVRHRGGVWDLDWDKSGRQIVTSSFDGVMMWDATTGALLGRMLYESTDHVYRVSFSPDGQLLLVTHPESGVRLIPIEAWGGPNRQLSRFRDGVPAALRADAVMASSPSAPLAGSDIMTPDGARRIAVAGRTLRFIDNDRQLAVFRLDADITNLKMTGDGTRLIIHLADGSARVWDIREPEERRKDMQAEWAERVPAGEYLDTLWHATVRTPDGFDSPRIPTNKLLDAIIADESLTPLRRLVAAELLDERQRELQWEANRVFGELTEDQTDPQAVQAAAAEADVHPRVRELLMQKAADWVHVPPRVNAEERLAEETQRRMLAEAAHLQAHAGNLFVQTGDAVGALTALHQALAIRREFLGAAHESTESVLADIALYSSGAEAVSLWRQVLDVRRTRLGVDDLQSLRYQESMIGDLWPDTRSRLEAIDLWRDLIDRAEHLPSPAYPTQPWIPHQYVELLQMASGQAGGDEYIARYAALPGSNRGYAEIEQIIALSQYRVEKYAEASSSALLAIEARVNSGASEHPLDHLLLSLSLSRLAEQFPTVHTLHAQHRITSREAFARARAIMADPGAVNPQGIPWSQDPDAVALLAEAQQLIDPPE